MIETLRLVTNLQQDLADPAFAEGVSQHAWDEDELGLFAADDRAFVDLVDTE